MGLLAIALFGVFSDGSKPATKEHLLDEVRKEHSNKFYQLPQGMKLVEIDFADDLAEGDMRGLQVGEAKD